MRRLFTIFLVAPLSACLATQPDLISSEDIDSFNFSYSLARNGTRTVGALGQASFEGRVAMEITQSGTSNRANILGDTSFTVDFDSETMTGTFDQMVLGDNRGNSSTVDGSLQMSATIASGAFGGDISGDLGIRIGGSNRQVDVTLATAGQFYGSLVSANKLAGSATGQGVGATNIDFDRVLFYGQ